MTVLATVNELALSVFAVVLASTLGITYWASRRQRTATEFWAAGRGISGVQTASPWRATTSRRRPSWASPG
jgi:Na+(H+)/acetate symporter ActP